MLGNNKYKYDIDRAHTALYLKKFKKYEFEKELAKELKMSKTYGKSAYLLIQSTYGVETNVMYYIFGLKNNELVYVTATTSSDIQGMVQYGQRIFNNCYIHINSICDKTSKNKILFDVLDKCKDGVIKNIIVSKNSATILFDFANRDSIKAICDKYDNVTYDNLPSLHKRQCKVKIKFNDSVNEHADIFNFDFK